MCGIDRPDIYVRLQSKRECAGGVSRHIDRKEHLVESRLAGLAIERDAFHGEWNYRLMPRASRRIG